MAMSDKSDVPKTNTSSGLLNETKKLKAVFPQFVKDGKVDFDALKAWFSDDGQLPEKDEKYSLGWAGRSKAIKATRTPATGTLKPVKDESKDWETTQNLFIEGDNLEVLKLLQRQYAGKIKMIYADPPYNTGNDFVYTDRFSEGVSDYFERYGKSSAVNEKQNQQASERYHSNWLTMMYPRLYLAKSLLCEDGLIYVSIDDNEAHNLRLLMDEIFGDTNFVDCLVWKKRYGGGAKEKHYVTLHEYVLVYARNIDALGELTIPLSEESIERYYTQQDENYKQRGPFRTHPLEATKSMGDRPNLIFPIKAPDGSEVMPKRQWLWSRDTVEDAIKHGELHFVKNGEWSVHTKQYLRGRDGNMRVGKPQSVIDDVYTQHGTNEIIDLFSSAQIFPFPKPSDFVKKFVAASTTIDSTVLDIFSGSGTTAHSVMKLNAEDGGNRKHIQIQLPEQTDEKSEAFKQGYKDIPSISRERIRRAGKKVKSDYADEMSKRKKELDIGFRAFKLTPSNYRRWHFVDNNENAEAQIKTQAKLISDNPLIDDADSESVIYEVALKEGFDVSIDPVVTKLGSMDCHVFTDTDSDRKLYVSLDTEIDDRAVIEAKLKQNDVFVCLDNSFKNSSQKLNLTENGVNLKVI